MINGVDVDAVKSTIDAIKTEPGLANVSFGIESQWQSGCHQVARTAELVQNDSPVSSRAATYVMESDEPMALLGTDKAASPGEYILQALAGCYAVTFAQNAAVRGIELSNLKFEMHADFDLHGFLGLDEHVRPGAQAVGVIVHAESPNATSDELQDLVEVVQQRSPIRDTLAAPVEVSTRLAQG